jgi:uncharacterized protein (TIGR03382 family)
MSKRLHCWMSPEVHPVGRCSPWMSRPGLLGRALAATTLAAVLLPGQASAQQSTAIDDFTVAQGPETSNQNGVEDDSSQSGADILGGERDIAVTRTSGAGDASVEVSTGSFQYNMDVGVVGRASIIWDGVDAPSGGTGPGEINFVGLRTPGPRGVDLSFAGRTDQLEMSFQGGIDADDMISITITLYANDGASASLTRAGADLPDGTTSVVFPFSLFELDGISELDITDVGAVRLDVTSPIPAVDLGIESLRGSSSVNVKMVDQVFDSAGNPKNEPAVPGDIIRYTVIIENPDEPAGRPEGLATPPLRFAFDPALAPNNGLTTLRPGSVNVPTGATVDQGNEPDDVSVVVNLESIPNRNGTGVCPTDNTVSGCVSFTFEVVVNRVLPPNFLETFPEGVFLPAQGTLTVDPDGGIPTDLLTDDPDLTSPVRPDDLAQRNLTQVASFCGDGVLDPGEGCDFPAGGPDDFCTDDCFIRSVENCPDGQPCPAPGCTSGEPNCPICNGTAPGNTGDESCESGFCNPDGNVCQDCGNGTLDEAEDCDDGNLTDGDGCSASCETECGNGSIEPNEGCDDGNTMDGDGCNAMCLIESIEVIGDCALGQCPPVSCTEGSPNCPACRTMGEGATGDASCASGYCNADGYCQDCADGNLDEYEGCDDTNETSGDGCNATCLIESCPEGQSCPVSPDCTSGSPNCPICNDDPDGATGDASCESNYCDPDTNTCTVLLPRLGGGGCSATVADAGIGLSVLIVVLMGWLFRRRRSAAGAIAILMAAMAFPQLAHAQEEDSRNFSAERFKLSSDRDGILDVESGTVIGHLNWDLGFWLGYADDPLALYMADGDERIDSFLTRRIGGELVAALGFGKRLQLGLQIPVILDQNYAYMDAALEPESTTGIGDISVHPKLQLLFARDFGVDLAIIPVVTLPSRGSESYFGDISLTFAPMLAASRQMNRLGLGANLGYRLRSDTPEVLGLEVVDEAFARFGASYRVNSDPEKPLDLGASMSLSTAATDFFGNFNRNHAEGLVGANYQVSSDWNLFGGGGLGLNPGFGTPDWRVLAGLRFSKRPLVCEAPLVAHGGRCGEECNAPEVWNGKECALPECPSGFERVGTECMLKVGCDGNPPNKDADCDTLPSPPWIQLGPPDDAYDKNRTEPRKHGEPVDPSGYKFGDTVPVEEGKTDFPEDIEQYDYCPTVPGKVEHHGCPPPTVTVNQCEKGSGRGTITVSPEIAFLPDSAILTLPSRVPLEALVQVLVKDPALLVAINVGNQNANRELAQRRADAIAAFLQKNGVKTDSMSIVGLGVAGGTAADEPASYPVSFERYCPEDVPSNKICKEMKLSDEYKIEFKANSDEIQPASKEMLKRDVLWILRQHPQVRVEVQGHTSSEGRLEYNMDLSRRRARAVVNYLVGEGIPADRLTAVGHGPKIPLVSPERTEADREKNRRIEFSVRARKECGDCTRFEVGKIQFEFNSGVIKPESFPELDSVVRKLLANPEVHLLIEGHTSSEGSARGNQRLSGIRAEAVRKYLVEKGVAANRLASRGFGESKLLVNPDDTEEKRETNRRVEFTITRGRPECPE